MFNLIEYSNNYSKKSGSLWQYYRDNNTVNSKSFKFMTNITGENTAASNSKDCLQLIAKLILF